MKVVRSFGVALALFVPVACGKGEVNAGELVDKAKSAAEKGLESIKDLDVSSLTPAKMQEKASEIADQVAAKLKAVHDEASASDAVAQLDPVVDKLKQMKTALAENMPDMGSLRQGIESLKQSLAGNETVMNTLRPLLDKLDSLMR